MEIEGRIVVVTGGGSGIGEALAAAAVSEGAGGVVIGDRDTSAAERVAQQYSTARTVVIAQTCDAGSGVDIQRLVAACETRFGRIDLFCSNAGIMVDGGLDLPIDQWNRSWSINVMAHVHAARAAMPGMLRSGSGYFLNVCSAAGMLTAPGAAPYATTKHAALGFAEWLAIVYGERGIGVSVLCPEAVRTDMLAASLAANPGVRRIVESGLILDAPAVAAAAMAGVKQGQFLITPHPRTLTNTQRKWADPGRWIAGMREFLRMAS